MTGLIILEGVVIAILGLLVAGLLRSHAEILARLHELGAGLESPRRPGPGLATVDSGQDDRNGAAPAHDIAGETPRGESAVVGVVGTATNTLLAFLSSGCATCANFWETFRQVGSIQLPEKTRLVVVTKSADAESVSAIEGLAAGDLTVVMSTEAWENYGIPGAPYFMLVDGPRGQVVGEGTAHRWDQVSSLISQAIADSSHRMAPSRARPSDRRDLVDAELLAAGVGPGHPSLYPEHQRLPDDGRDV